MGKTRATIGSIHNSNLVSSANKQFDTAHFPLSHSRSPLPSYCPPCSLTSMTDDSQSRARYRYIGTWAARTVYLRGTIPYSIPRRIHRKPTFFTYLLLARKISSRTRGSAAGRPLPRLAESPFPSVPARFEATMVNAFRLFSHKRQKRNLALDTYVHIRPNLPRRALQGITADSGTVSTQVQRRYYSGQYTSGRYWSVRDIAPYTAEPYRNARYTL